MLLIILSMRRFGLFFLVLKTSPKSLAFWGEELSGHIKTKLAHTQVVGIELRGAFVGADEPKGAKRNGCYKIYENVCFLRRAAGSQGR